MSPLVLLRLDAAIVERVRREDRLGELARAALVAIAVGASAYGAAFGLWRDRLQAIYGAIKLPCVVLGVALFTAASSAVLAPMLGARLRPMQSIVAILASLAVTSSILGAVAPIAMLLVVTGAPHGPDDAAVAQSLVLAHTFVIAVAGTAGVLALVQLLSQLVPTRAIAKRIVVAWLATQLMIGAQLSWLLRPFLGRPGSTITFFSPDALEGGFFDEILRLATARFGDLAPFLLAWLGAALLFWIGWVLIGETRGVRVRVWPRGLEVLGRELVAWTDVLSAIAVGARVRVQLARDEALVERVLDVPCTSLAEARALATNIEGARSAHVVGPYR